MARTGSAGADRDDGGAWGVDPSGVDLGVTRARFAMAVIGFGLVIVGGVGLVIGVVLWVGCWIRWGHRLRTAVLLREGCQLCTQP